MPEMALWTYRSDVGVGPPRNAPEWQRVCCPTIAQAINPQFGQSNWRRQAPLAHDRRRSLDVSESETAAQSRRSSGRFGLNAGGRLGIIDL